MQGEFADLIPTGVQGCSFHYVKLTVNSLGYGDERIVTYVESAISQKIFSDATRKYSLLHVLHSSYALYEYKAKNPPRPRYLWGKARQVLSCRLPSRITMKVLKP